MIKDVIKVQGASPSQGVVLCSLKRPGCVATLVLGAVLLYLVKPKSSGKIQLISTPGPRLPTHRDTQQIPPPSLPELMTKDTPDLHGQVKKK